MKNENRYSKGQRRILISQEAPPSQAITHTPDERSLPMAAAVPTHKAAAVCATETRRASKLMGGRYWTPAQSAGERRMQRSGASGAFQPAAGDAGCLAWGLADEDERASSLVLCSLCCTRCVYPQNRVGTLNLEHLCSLTPRNAPSSFIAYSLSKSLGLTVS